MYGWNEEEDAWTCGKAIDARGEHKSGAQCDHFTQNGWGTTSSVGYAVAHCSSNTPFPSRAGSTWTFIRLPETSTRSTGRISDVRRAVRARVLTRVLL